MSWLGPFKVIFLSVPQEAMKRNLKQKSHRYEIYNNSYMKS